MGSDIIFVATRETGGRVIFLRKFSANNANFNQNLHKLKHTKILRQYVQ